MNFNTNKYYNTRYSETKYTSIQNSTNTNTNTKKSNVLDESEFPPLKKVSAAPAQVNENSTLINEAYTKNNKSTILNFLEAAKKVYNPEEEQVQENEHPQDADEMNVITLNEDAFRRHYDEDSD
jgi:hypothetical protein